MSSVRPPSMFNSIHHGRRDAQPSLTIHLSRPTSPILQIAFLRLLDLVVAGPSPQYVALAHVE
ncbi:hypothetical protein BD779DRAFT_1685865 [Infundibulicybe gibba]|nr:hypothetical protein BD779DRAFT_1685865 [Infundibulicybe gibba]